jgi:glycine betaine/choline ABC-type transport system substrate-binding protein
VDATTILAGAIPAALLALAVDGSIAWLERRLRRRGGVKFVKPAAALFVLACLAGGVAYARAGTHAIVVGSKNFTEQVILGELLAQLLEAEGLTVVRKLNLGGTFVCDRGIRAGDLDLYVEYTGTAVSAVFHEDVPREPARAFERARALYAPAGLTVAEPLGFNNTFTILVRAADARQLNLDSIEDLQPLAPKWLPGFGYEFLQRDDGYPGLAKTYGLEFGRPPRAMDLSLIYRALAEQQIDLTAGDATSALIDALDLTPLADTRRYFPPYDAVPIVRTATLLREPALGRALARVAGRISDREMRALNAAVDVQKRDVRQVVAEFLKALEVGR